MSVEAQTDSSPYKLSSAKERVPDEKLFAHVHQTANVKEIMCQSQIALECNAGPSSYDTTRPARARAPAAVPARHDTTRNLALVRDD
ncbi:hypothetical protein RR46_02487 [Papilio xuthus]|uniref:Uncharacterized protein n=1 Tax=Papilio xuthus TaxID=66420 RepID=A0A194QIN3_PAPXU|nr:hypothetical protein RR46_02487 [Papilio xuthus]